MSDSTRHPEQATPASGRVSLHRDAHCGLLTCENLFPHVGTQLEVDDALDDSLHRAELRIEAQREEHEEEEDGPDVAGRKLVDRLSKENESQACAAGRLDGDERKSPYNHARGDASTRLVRCPAPFPGCTPAPSSPRRPRGDRSIELLRPERPWNRHRR